MPATAPVSGEESAFEPSTLESAEPAPRAGWWIGWRRHVLMGAALLGCLAIFGLARWLAVMPQLDAQWGSDGQGGLVLVSSPLPELQGQEGRVLRAVSDASGQPRTVNSLLLHPSPRWQVHDDDRAQQVAQHELLAQRLAAGTVELWFDGGARVLVHSHARGLAGLGLLLWPLNLLALALVLLALAVVIVRPQVRNALYMLMSACQAGNLLIIALETTRGLGLPPGLAAIDLDLRLVLDACTGAAMVHVFVLHPYRQPHAMAWAAASWCAVVLGLLLIHAAVLAPGWWWAQGLCLGLGAMALAAVMRSHGARPNPFALIMRRFGLMALGTLVLVTLAVAATAHLPEVAHGVAVAASVAWYLFLASLLLLMPFLARGRQLLREFALLAGISAVAASMDLVFVAVFSIGPFTSLAVAVFVALAVYAGARQFILNHMLGHSMLTTERTFDHLYRAARAVQAHPRRYPQLLGQLLRDLFEPLEMAQIQASPTRAQLVGAGASLVVPARMTDEEQPTRAAFMLRFAQRGQRLFTLDDARLADRVVDQLRRAVAYDQAVERGRHEERLRIAQDLHDDIGARLLTLMYQAPSPEMEDYIRHTLQDLKTLTRGLSVAEHRLSHAGAEWKADLSQRLAAAQAQLGWVFGHDEDLRLSVVQWSALTRVLRELVSNALFHGHATRIEVDFELRDRRLRLNVADDGGGRNPQEWSHGLGLGGVRKRVKLLGGSVAWRENEPRGIVCRVQVDDFGNTG
jgi:signal transduction histidine kinase